LGVDGIVSQWVYCILVIIVINLHVLLPEICKFVITESFKINTQTSYELLVLLNTIPVECT
jgi:hypothetical protein